MENLISKIAGKNIRIVFAEGDDYRVLDAAIRLRDQKILLPILCGDRAKLQGLLTPVGTTAEGMELLDPKEFSDIEAMVLRFVEIRRGKVDSNEARKLLMQANYFCTMYVEMGYADGMLGGANFSTADTLRPALQLVKTAQGNNIVSSSFLMTKNKQYFIFGDCSLNIDPSVEELIEITLQSVRTARMFGMVPVVGLLSYSSDGSGKGPSVTKVQEAVTRLKRMPLDFEIDGEMQVDAAVNETVAKLKMPNSNVAGHVNVLIFPNIDAGNIGYKLVARFGEYEAVGPVLQGLYRPINDLSRGCNGDEVFKMAIVTANQTLTNAQ